MIYLGGTGLVIIYIDNIIEKINKMISIENGNAK
tara:strand:+ start:609 stop:710 length:102 start_codon:yes stop_codon:yes gene_type:complete